MRHINSANENDSLLENFVQSNCTAQVFITNMPINNNTKDIIVLCDGKDIIKYDFESKKIETLNYGFYVFGNVTNENCDNLYLEMMNMVENNSRKTKEMMEIYEKFYKINGKYFAPVYKSIIRKNNTNMIFNEYMCFTISQLVRTKHIKSKISNMIKIDSKGELINNIF